MRARKPSPAMLVALLALFVALGGISWAAVSLPRNSVGTKQLKKNAVTAPKIKRGAVTSAKVRNGSLRQADFASGTLLQGLQGPAGAKGDQGATGPVGPTFASLFPNGDNDPAPPATPDSATLNGQWSHTFVTPSAGRLLVFASLRVFGVTCSVGTANAFLYLDGVGVPGSGQPRPTSANANQYTALALTDPVPAGEHTLRISYDCPDGNPSSDSSSNAGDLGAVLIGG
jgi:hypothetical protein